MENRLFEIEYRLVLLDDTFMQTKTHVVAKNKEKALDKLSLWRQTQMLNYKEIEYLEIEEFHYNVIN